MRFVPSFCRVKAALLTVTRSRLGPAIDAAQVQRVERDDDSLRGRAGKGLRTRPARTRPARNSTDERVRIKSGAAGFDTDRKMRRKT